MRGGWRGGIALLACAVATPACAQERSPDEVVAAVRAGGTIVVCRHAATTDFREREPVDYDDPTTQRLLSPEGEEQSRRLGRAITALGIDVTDLRASPMSRARRTAELMFGRLPAIDSVWHTNGSDYEGGALDARLERLRTPVESEGGTVLIVSHIGTMRSALPLEERSVDEGDCVVVRPWGGNLQLLGVVPPEAWEAAAGGGFPPTA